MKLKQELLNACFEYTNKRIANYKNEIATINDAIENNDKGGDDDDSGNGKLFNDLEKNSQYLNDAQNMLEHLKSINPNIATDQVMFGSIVRTTNNNFFISVSAGKIELEDGSFFAISLHSPIGMLLKNKTVGDHIQFNDNQFTITEVI